MASRLNPYLMFAGDARQALQFYKEVFGGTLVLSTYGEAGQPDTSMTDKIMHGMLETPATTPSWPPTPRPASTSRETPTR